MKLACKPDRFLVLTGFCLTLYTTGCASGQSSGPWILDIFIPTVHLCNMLHIDIVQVKCKP